ncbi:MAG: hypothetical protein ACJ74W_11285 [Pyrinomonadaceae bacterium]
MSRLAFAPKLKEIEITDITKGIGIFTPKPDKPVSFAVLQTALKQAGYTLDTADLNVAGVLAHDGAGWWLVVESSGQRFALAGAALDKLLVGFAPATRVQLVGDWQTVGKGATAREVITPRELKQAASTNKAATVSATRGGALSAVSFMRASYEPASAPLPASATDSAVAAAAAPIRTTSPGLTVYKGGAVIPRLSFVRQHLGALTVNRQVLNLSVTYTPTSTLQLEADVPFARTAYDDRVTSGAGAGFGNLTLWGKYRFYRKVKTYGDRQAAVRFGFELPTGKKTAPSGQQLNAPAFVRQQLTSINGGLAPAIDLAYSQAIKRFVFGGNVAGTLRTERAGFRTGHELRVNTDAELVIFPLKYRRPVRELFASLETTFVHRGVGRVDGRTVADSKSTEYYLAPGLQYVATPQLVVEGSVQLPVIRHTGAQVLRTERNVLVALHYLF